MSEKLSLLNCADPKLRLISSPISDFNPTLNELLEDLQATMYETEGIGISAIQVGIPLRITVIDLSEEQNTPLVLINPKIKAFKGLIESQEGCLSVPGVYASVMRHEIIEIDYQDPKGKRHSLTAEGLLSRCIQHEIDHMEGKLFIDYLPLDTREALLLEAQLSVAP